MASQPLSFAARIYRRALVLYPTRLREMHGSQMLAVFVELDRDARERRGVVGGWWLLGRSLLDVVRSAPAARRYERARDRPVPSRAPRHSRLGKEATPMTTLDHDLSVAWRTLRKSPGFTTVAALTLALGIGANTAIFSVVYGVLLRPLGLEDPDSLAVVELHRKTDRADHSGFFQTYLWDLQEAVEGRGEIEKLTSYIFESVTLERDGQVEEIGNVVIGDASFFEVLGAVPLRGRLLGEEDRVPGGLGSTCVISESLWHRAFGGDPEIVGRTVVLDERPFVVVGVVAAGTPLPSTETQLWMTQDWDPEDYALLGRLQVLARLTAGADLDVARERLAAAAADLERDHPRFADYTVALESFREALVGNVRPAIVLSAVAVGLILLIACANMANLLLARAATREREMATRRALGARGGQLASQLIVESVSLASLGGTVGLALAVLLHRVLLAMAPSSMPRVEAVRLDLPVLLFAAAATLVTGVLFGLAPVLHTIGLDLARSMGGGVVTTAGRRYPRIRQALVVIQVAVAVTLLIGAALMVRSLLQLRAVDPGFELAGVGGARIYLDADAYPEDADEAEYWRALLDRLLARPEIEAAGASSGLPMDPVTIDYDLPYTLPGEDPDPAGEDVEQAFFRTITPGYFEAMGIPLLAGRTFDGRDRATTEGVALVNRSFAEHAWPQGDPIGQSFSIYGGRRELRVVGVVGDVHFTGPAASYKPEFFVPYTQMTYGAMTMVARGTASDADPTGHRGAALAARAIASEALALDPSQPVSSTFTLEDLLRGALSTDRFVTLLLVAFAVVALLLSAAGIYGVISYWVNQSRRELGVRMAFGASAGSIVGLVLRRSLTVATLGLLLGMVGGLAAGRLVAGFLFGIEPTDAVALAAVIAMLSVTALLASLLPAWRASRLDPIAALRVE